MPYTGFQNFGGAISRSVGLFFIEAFHIQTTVPCNFTNLPYMVMLSHMLLPLLCIPLTFVFLPNVRMTDNVDISSEENMAPASKRYVNRTCTLWYLYNGLRVVLIYVSGLHMGQDTQV